jgi:alpha,alpha-trehalose-phosphate synthase [UDP-forming]
LPTGSPFTALEPILRARGGAWIGWTGATGPAPRPSVQGEINIRPVSMSGAEVDGFYHGFSNSTIWPLYHHAIRTPTFHRPWWARYAEVNLRFARAAARAARRRDTVWIHDYQLQLVPMMLRELRPDLKIGFFLHIPFPPEELFAWLPWRRQILTGLLGADLVGFQTYADAQNFSRAARRYAGAEGTDTRLTFGGRTIAVNDFPISIDFRAFEAAASKPSVIRQAERIRERVGANRKIILAVDRLDYTKGIDVRLRAYSELLRRGEVKVEKTVLIQIAVPSRDAVLEYAQLRSTVEQAVGRINGEYGLPGWVAVHYFRRSVPRDELLAFYRAADVMAVTPLRDGMNLVAKEYVACRTDNTGVLVLSEFAGAAREMRRALLVNPLDVDGTGAAMLAALKMPRAEMKQRMSILRMVVRRHDVFDWAEEFLDALARTRRTPA